MGDEGGGEEEGHWIKANPCKPTCRVSLSLCASVCVVAHENARRRDRVVGRWEREVRRRKKSYIYIYIKVDPTRKHNFLLKTDQQRTAPNNNSDDDDDDGDVDTHIHTYRERREEEEAEVPFMCAASATAASAHGYAQAHTRVHPPPPSPIPFFLHGERSEA